MNETTRTGRLSRILPKAMPLTLAVVTIIAGSVFSFRSPGFVVAVVAACAGWTCWRVFGISACGTILGVISIDGMVLVALLVYQVDCPTSLGFLIPLVLIGFIPVPATSVWFLAVGANGTRRRSNSVAALISLLGFPAIFLFVMLPLATESRRLRHIEEMGEKMPLLMTISDDVEASAERMGRIPKGEAEFHRVLAEREHDAHETLGCCWIIDYEKTHANRFTLVYKAMDVEYLYDSDMPGRGWQRVEPAEEVQRSQPKEGMSVSE